MMKARTRTKRIFYLITSLLVVSLILANTEITDRDSTLEGLLTIGNLITNSINTTHIKDRTLINDDLADSSINTTHILDSTVLTGDISDRTLTAHDLADSSINTTHILDGTITGGDLTCTGSEILMGNGTCVPDSNYVEDTSIGNNTLGAGTFTVLGANPTPDEFGGNITIEAGTLSVNDMLVVDFFVQNFGATAIQPTLRIQGTTTAMAISTPNTITAGNNFYGSYKLFQNPVNNTRVSGSIITIDGSTMDENTFDGDTGDADILTTAWILSLTATHTSASGEDESIVRYMIYRHRG